MTRKATDRLLTAVVVSVSALIVSILAGEPEAALLAMPWAVLLILGFGKSQNGETDIRVIVDDDRVVVGDEVNVNTTIDGWSGSVMVSCEPSDGFWANSTDDDLINKARVVDVLGPNETTIEVPLDTTQWGVHDVGHVDVTVTEPYGLFRWSGKAGTPRHVRVHPRPAQIQNLLTPWLVRSVTGAHNSRVSGRGVEYADIRLFASGDSLRDINWKASARSQDLWTSQRHPERATDVVVLVDSFVESGHDVRTLFGLAIEGAMALAESHLTVSDRVGLVELGGTVSWLTPNSGRHQLQRLTDHLLSTGLHSHSADRNLALLMSRALPPRSFVVALTPLLDGRFIDALFTLAAHGHDVGVIECADTRWDPGDEADSSRKLGERIWKAERQVIRDRLTEHGVALATWRKGDHLELTLAELTKRRRFAVRGRHR